MSVTQKFKDAVSGAAVNVTTLYTGTWYPVLHCERVETKYGMAVRVSLREEANDNVFTVFLSRHYADTNTDGDMAAINDRKIQYYLTYRGKSATTNHLMSQMDV